MTLYLARLFGVVVLSTIAPKPSAAGMEPAACGGRMLVPASRFTVPSIRSMYESFRATCPSAPVSQLEILIAGKAAESYLEMLHPPSVESQGWSFTGAESREMKRLRLGIAEVIGIGGNTVLRMHEESGALRRIVLNGTDPLRIQIGDENVEIVFMTIDEWSIRGPSEEWPTFFVVYRGPLRVEHLSALSLSMQKRIGFRRGSILFRADRWFVGNPGHPPFNPYFPTPDKEPDWNDVYLSDTGYCVLDGAVPECGIHNSEINPIKPPAPELKFPPPADPLSILR